MSEKKTSKAAELVKTSVQELLNSDSYKEALRFRRRFEYPYSFTNNWLIFCQCPHARMVAGFRKWQTVGRQVRKGEKSLKIIAPIIKKDEDGSTRPVGFRTVSVFDYSQTDGDDVPLPPDPEDITLEHERLPEFIHGLRAYTVAQGVRVVMASTEVKDGAYGFYRPKDNSIHIKTQAEASIFTTLAHELGHALMHGTREGREEAEGKNGRELEAESFAFILCDSLGIDTARFSFPYIAGWCDEPQELMRTTERACKAADKVLATLNLEPLAVAA